MPILQLCCSQEQSCSPILFDLNSDCVSYTGGGLFLEPTIPDSFTRLISSRIPPSASSCSVSSAFCPQQPVVSGVFRRPRRVSAAAGGCFLSVSLRGGKFAGDPKVYSVQNGDENSETDTSDGANTVVEQGKSQKVRVREGTAMNTTKHLWAGAIAAMVSRYIFLQCPPPGKGAVTVLLCFFFSLWRCLRFGALFTNILYML